MNNDSKYIELRYETGWKHPVQAYSILKRKNKPDIVTHFFAEWNTFEEAINNTKRGNNIIASLEGNSLKNISEDIKSKGFCMM